MLWSRVANSKSQKFFPFVKWQKGKKYNNKEVYSYALRITAMYLQLQFEYEYFEISCIFSFNFNTKRQEFCCWSNATQSQAWKQNAAFSLAVSLTAELTIEFVFHGTLLSYCCLMSAYVSGLVNLCITCNDIEVEIAYYIAVSHNHYFPTNVKVYKSFGTQY